MYFERYNFIKKKMRLRMRLSKMGGVSDNFFEIRALLHAFLDFLCVFFSESLQNFRDLNAAVLRDHVFRKESKKKLNHVLSSGSRFRFGVFQTWWILEKHVFSKNSDTQNPEKQWKNHENLQNETGRPSIEHVFVFSLIFCEIRVLEGRLHVNPENFKTFLEKNSQNIKKFSKLTKS